MTKVPATILLALGTIPIWKAGCQPINLCKCNASNTWAVTNEPKGKRMRENERARIRPKRGKQCQEYGRKQLC